uniref:Reversion-inducing cysteine-rich protein with Kazal motifs-like n=1 Tax=Phallusia mammillata TaxID=59560 RepID=A0A6F9DQQ5_9ASCI|nr:reversion-inducing cysteine-rich protein with Kazal motifs-like [Phallusia mammillata]
MDMQSSCSFNTLLFTILMLLSKSDVNGTWVGQKCCEDAMVDQCRFACLQANSRFELIDQCRNDYEEEMFKCIYKQESRQRCCGRNRETSSSCRHMCERAFGNDRRSPTPNDIIAVVDAQCGDTMERCMEEFANATKQTFIDKLPCCDLSDNSICQKSCKKILQSEISPQEPISQLVEVCGELIPHLPLWKCFIETNVHVEEPGRGRTLPEMMCCDKALSVNCKDNCKKVFANPWPEPPAWEDFQNTCESYEREAELTGCLEEVRSPCKMGCHELSFCTNFNNRPTELFRKCDADGDTIARHSYNSWLSGVIRILHFNISVKDITTCEPEKWKMVACAMNIKPCSKRTGEAIICRSDCLDLLNKCVHKHLLPAAITVDQICESLSPHHLQSKCISISTYTKPGQVSKTVNVTQPCLPNPCESGEVCVINRNPCDATKPCPKYSCLPGCKMGQGSTFVVPYGSLVRVLDHTRGDGCFKACTCTKSGSLRRCHALQCTDGKRECNLAGQLRSHGSHFYVDCNFCSCYNGVVTCTKRQCLTSKSSVEEKRKFTGVPCDCENNYSPVCGADGRTYPSLCLAACFGMTQSDVTIGTCSSQDPCQNNPCGERERCVASPRVCLTQIHKCQQYECIPRFRVCSRWLRNAIQRATGSLKPSHRHQLVHDEEQVILSSSRFFSSAAFLSNNSVSCDVNNQQFDDVCKLMRAKRRNLAYTGKCKSTCSSHHGRPVCGHDRVTYNNSCVAEANGVLVDHVGACKSVGLAEDKKNAEACEDVMCPPLANTKCKAIRPPDECCPLCGGLLRVMLNKQHLRAITEDVWKGPVTVHDIVWQLRSRLNVLECAISGQLTTEGDLAILIVSNVENPSLVQVEACSREAERLSRLINSRSPTLTSYLTLSPLTAATLSTSDHFNGAVTSRGGLLSVAVAWLTYWLATKTLPVT